MIKIEEVIKGLKGGSGPMSIKRVEHQGGEINLSVVMADLGLTVRLIKGTKNQKD